MNRFFKWLLGLEGTNNVGPCGPYGNGPRRNPFGPTEPICLTPRFDPTKPPPGPPNRDFIVWPLAGWIETKESKRRSAEYRMRLEQWDKEFGELVTQKIKDGDLLKGKL